MIPEGFGYPLEIEPAQTREQEDAMLAWCVANIGKYNETWYTYYSEIKHKTVIYFVREQDSVLFALRWA